MSKSCAPSSAGHFSIAFLAKLEHGDGVKTQVMSGGFQCPQFIQVLSTLLNSPCQFLSDNFEVKDKKRKMYPWGFWYSSQKQHFIRGTIQKADHQYIGHIQMRSIVQLKSQRDLSHPWPPSYFLPSTHE